MGESSGRQELISLNASRRQLTPHFFCLRFCFIFNSEPNPPLVNRYQPAEWPAGPCSEFIMEAREVDIFAEYRLQKLELQSTMLKPREKYFLLCIHS